MCSCVAFARPKTPTLSPPTNKVVGRCFQSCVSVILSVHSGECPCDHYSCYPGHIYFLYKAIFHMYDTETSTTHLVQLKNKANTGCPKYLYFLNSFNWCAGSHQLVRGTWSGFQFEFDPCNYYVDLNNKYIPVTCTTFLAFVVI